MDVTHLPTGVASAALKVVGAVKRWADRPRLKVEVEAAGRRSADLVLINEGKRALADIEVRILDVEPCGACVQGGPRHQSLVVRVDRRLPWPTGEALGRLGPKTGERIPLCSVVLATDDSHESFVSVQLIDRDPVEVQVRATAHQYELIDPSRASDPTSVTLPAEYAFLMDAPARIRLAVSAANEPTTMATVEVFASREVPLDGPMWSLDQSVSFSLTDSSLEPHPMVRSHFPSVQEARDR